MTTIGVGLLKDPRVGRFMMSKVPLYILFFRRALGIGLLLGPRGRWFPLIEVPL